MGHVRALPTLSSAGSAVWRDSTSRRPTSPTPPTGKVKYFEGTPIPTSILIVALLAVALASGRIDEHMWLGAYRIGPAWLHPLVLVYAASGSAMISATLKIPKP